MVRAVSPFCASRSSGSVIDQSAACVTTRERESPGPRIVDDEAIVSVTVGEKTIDLRGRVRYAEPRIGFGMQFTGLTNTQREALQPLLA